MTSDDAGAKNGAPGVAAGAPGGAAGAHNFIVSAPGKVIIFGEHAAVFGKPAIAAAVSLRTYMLVTPNDADSESILLDFPDIKFRYSCKISDLPWDTVKRFGRMETPDPSEELVPELVSELTTLLSRISEPIHYSAAYSFIYLYVNLCNRDTPGCKFSVRSTLPIGAGLGSSASISVCLSAAFAMLGGHIKKPTVANDGLSTENDEIHFIDAWAFMGEKCIHGNPSGVDNAVATHGGAVMFQRMPNSSTPVVRTSMRNFPPLKLLLTNTKQPRKTSDLVSNVIKLSQEFPKTTTNIMEAIEQLTREGYNIMIKPFFNEEARDRLRTLVQLNHGLLISLGVSHPKLEKIRMLTDELQIGQTKLTGAGGGGCAITLLNDNVADEALRELKQQYAALGFEPFETILGGKGVGFFDKVKLQPQEFLAFKDRDEIELKLQARDFKDWTFW